MSSVLDGRHGPPSIHHYYIIVQLNTVHLWFDVVLNDQKRTWGNGASRDNVVEDKSGRVKYFLLGYKSEITKSLSTINLEMAVAFASDNRAAQ